MRPVAGRRRLHPALLLPGVRSGPKSRPLLQTADPRATLVDLLEKRAPVYRLADVHVESSRASKRQTRDAVLGALEAWFTERRAPAGAGEVPGRGERM